MKDYTKRKKLIKASLELLRVLQVVSEYKCGKLALSIREKCKLEKRLTDSTNIWENARKGVTQ
tara:strand:- start:226 stop:414 length:189 start_codon:yes stop_codon:yes gene_type:complete